MKVFIVKFKCKEAVFSTGIIMTSEGDECWLAEESDGWVPATSCSVSFSDHPPVGIKTFGTREEANNFMELWEGHPWYHTPNGDYEIIEVVEKYEKVVVGYDVKI